MEQNRCLYVYHVCSILCLWWITAKAQLAGIHSDDLLFGQLVIPRRVNHHGEFVMNTIRHHQAVHQNKSNTIEEKDLHYRLEVDNETLHLELKPHSNFLGPHLIIERHRRDLRTRKKINNKSTNCHFHGKIRGHSESRVAVSTCEGLIYNKEKIKDRRKHRDNGYAQKNNKTRDDQPLTRPPAVAAFQQQALRRDKFYGVSRRRQIVRQSDMSDKESRRSHWQAENSEELSPVSKDKHGKLKDPLNTHKKKQRHQSRRQREVNNCGTVEPRRHTQIRLEWQPQGKVRIQSGRKIKRHNHILNASPTVRSQIKFKYKTEDEESLVTESHSKYYRRQDQSESLSQRIKSSSLMPSSPLPSPLSLLSSSLSLSSSSALMASDSSRSKRSISSPRHVETLIVADASMVAFHNDVETYLLTIMNMVSVLYKDPSIGNSIEIVVVKIVLLEEDEAHPDFNLTLNAQENLDMFCAWQSRLNTANENDPEHHDVAILVTRKSICGKSCITLGVANVGGMCKPKKSCSVNEDNGITLSHTIAHELGHNFGMFHDTAKIGCHPRIGSIVHIMTPSFGADTLQVCWSNCSRKYITYFLDRGFGDCLDDPPTSIEQYNYPELPPGVIFNAELQCRLQFNLTDSKVGACSSLNEICSSLWCEVNGECVTNMRPTAPGTSCGVKKWCQNGECVPMQALPPVNGGWGNWSEWSECSRSCGGGVSKQERECNNPQPANGGVFCIGERKRYEICNKQACADGDLSFRGKQCAAFNTVPFQGTIYKWQPFFDKNQPCKLFCTDIDETVIANWADTVIDGTPCALGTKNMCIDSICRKVGCDWSLNSGLEEDRCGICGGSGDKCKPVKGIFTESFNIAEGYIEIITIPAKARHIIIKEMKNTINFLSIAKANSSLFYLNGDSLISMPGEFVIAGAAGMYDRKNEQESISIPQPIQHPIALYVLVRNSEPKTDIYYEFTLPTTTMDMSDEGNYTWQLGEWTMCSKSCGGGLQYREPLCYRNTKWIGEEFCWSNAQNKRTMKEVRKCNNVQCSAHWWAGPWLFCPVTCISRNITMPFKRRSVKCLDEHDIVVDDSFCDIKTRPNDITDCGQFLNECSTTESMDASGGRQNGS